jgi:hypothetical protein
MTFTVRLTNEARETYNRLATENPAKYDKVRKTLGLMETNLRSSSLQTDEYTSLKGPNGEKMFEAYVESKTPSAYRVFWHYGPSQGVITVTAITPHP